MYMCIINFDKKTVFNDIKQVDESAVCQLIVSLIWFSGTVQELGAFSNWFLYILLLVYHGLTISQ